MNETELEISVKRIHRLNNTGNLNAYVDLVINDAILIKGLRIVNGPKGIFVSMPSEQSEKDKKWYDTVRCLKPPVYREITTKVLEAYEKEIG